MSKAIVERVRKHYPTPLASKHGEFLLELAVTLGPNYGLYKKSTGTFVTLPDGMTVSQDVVVHRDGRAWDVLKDGEGVAEPEWTPIARNDDPDRVYWPEDAPLKPQEPVPPTPALDMEPFIEAMHSIAQAVQESDAANARRDEANERRYRDVIAHFKAAPEPPPVVPVPPVNMDSVFARIWNLLGRGQR